MSNICPKCNKEYTSRPAISRDSRYREICPLCGTKEAIKILPKQQQKDILGLIKKVGEQNV